MNDQCLCKKLIRSPKNFFIWLIFAVILVLFLSLVIGSYCENEPKAGMMFGVLTVIYVVIFGVLAWRITRGKEA